MARFDLDLSEMRRRTARLQAGIEPVVRTVMTFQAARGEAEMKTNAPWTDQTSAARTGLHTLTRFTPRQYVIIFAHSVYYGIWLEVANSGNYQIIMPTLRRIGADTMSQLDGLFRKIK